MVLVPQYDLGASAGAGSLDQTERPAGRMAFAEKWLRDMGANPAGLSMIRVDGDSMSPTLSHGDEIIDRKSVVSGKSVSDRVDLGGRRLITKQQVNHNNLQQHDRPAQQTD